MKIRMYRQGFGDCFLLTFNEATQPVYMLIDCGVHNQFTGGDAKLQQVVADIATVTNHRLDYLILTHEHWDHLSGFKPTPDLFANFSIGELWFAWTEEPGHPLAETLRAAHGAAIQTLQRTIARGAQGDSLKRTLSEIAPVLEFCHEPMLGIGTGLGTDDLLNYARGIKRDHDEPRYFTPGNIVTLPTVPGMRIFVLGPPLDPQLIRQQEVSKKSDLIYQLTTPNPFTLVGFENALAGSDKSSPETLQYPFDTYYHVTPAEAEQRTDDFFRTYYGMESDKESVENAKWRRIEEDWLQFAGELALRVDNGINNTSLVLAFELSPGGDVLLFPGDAQVGNWESWHTIETWQAPADGTKVSTDFRAKDLLSRTRVYKASHHGSKNSTLSKQGLDLMTHPGLIVLIPVDETFTVKQKWPIPGEVLLGELNAKSKGRILRSDKSLPSSADLTALSVNARQKFLDAVVETNLYFELTIE